MTATLDRIWTTEPLTTRDALIERFSQTGRLVNLMRADREAWAGLSDAERRETVRRLMFAAHRLNPDRCLHRRAVREGAEMTARTEIEGTVATILAVLLMVCHRAARWVRGRVNGR